MLLCLFLLRQYSPVVQEQSSCIVSRLFDILSLNISLYIANLTIHVLVIYFTIVIGKNFMHKQKTVIYSLMCCKSLFIIKTRFHSFKCLSYELALYSSLCFYVCSISVDRLTNNIVSNCIMAYSNNFESFSS